MSGVRNVTDLFIWKQARSWSKAIYWRTQEGAFSRDQRLVVQINDSSESVMSNIAEGFGRGTQEEFITFLGYALRSTQYPSTQVPVPKYPVPQALPLSFPRPKRPAYTTVPL